MSSRLRKTLTVSASIFLVLCIAVSVFGLYLPSRSFPEIDGSVTYSGLDAPVDIYRDSFGIPHIYAQTAHDLFFAQGYVHAQDRFWQMDFWRHIGAGRLSEMLGESQVETDSFLRTLGWARVAEQELELLDDTTMDILTSYAEGVNAYLAGKSAASLSLEYSLLGLIAPGYEPDAWTPLHTLTWAKVMAWDLGGNMDEEIRNAVLAKLLSPEQMADLAPPYPEDHPVIVNHPWAGEGVRREDAASLPLDSLQPYFDRISTKVENVEALTGPRRPAVGSNSWVIAGELTASGKPLLANDPHLGAQMPSIWYEIGLHCLQKSDSCPYEVTGFSFAGAPGVIIGHNDRIAWGFTNVGPDVQDLFVERVNPENPNQYEVNGEWVDMEIVSETIRVAGKEPVELSVRYTRHGPVISDTYGSLEGFAENAAVQAPEAYAIALSWTALEPSTIFRAIWGFNRAQNWAEFREAASYFSVPAQNLVYADVDGNIGYQMPGSIPIRAAGDGSMPAIGWTGEYDWQGYLPFEELPVTFNPGEGYIVTANNPVTGPAYPYFISNSFDYGYRARRIVEMIESAPGPIDAAYIARMQGDNKSLIAEKLTPVLMGIDLQDPDLTEIRSILDDWDYQLDMESAPAALFQAFWRHLLIRTFNDDLPEDFRLEGDSETFAIVSGILEDPNSVWWDDQETLDVEGRDTLFRLAFADAVSELEDLQGRDPGKWRWGGLHTITFRNQSLGESGIAPVEAIFNRGAFETAGGSSIVNATGWNALESYEVFWLPSMRMIVDLDNLSNSQAINTTGQSGHAFHRHYVDMADMWRTVQYHPMLWDRAGVEAAAESLLTLTP